MDRRKKATITCAQTMLCPLELGRDDEHSIGECKKLCYRPRTKKYTGRQADMVQTYPLLSGIRRGSGERDDIAEFHRAPARIGRCRRSLGGLYDDEAIQFTLKNTAARNDRRSAGDHH